jgi:hypothetical protein
MKTNHYNFEEGRDIKLLLLLPFELFGEEDIIL